MAHFRAVAALCTLVVLSACGAASSTPSTPAGTDGSVPSAGAPVLAPHSPATPGTLLQLAMRFYAPSGKMCDAGAPSGAQHYAPCPFTDALRARYTRASPDGVIHGGGADGDGFLCHCSAAQPGAKYAAYTSGSAGTMTIFVGTTWVFAATAVRIDNRLLISDIKLTDPPCSNTELDACH